MGPHHINYTNGSVAWQEEPELEITSLDADIEPAPLFAELLSHPAIAAEITKAVTAISSLPGQKKTIHLSSGELSGPFFTPMFWKYQFSARLAEVAFTSPLLPDEVVLTSAAVSFNQDMGVIDDCHARFLDMPLSLNGRLTHHYWTDWAGRLTFNGTVNEEQRDWLLAEELAPLAWLPKIPCRLDDFSVAWEGDEVTINGAIIAHGQDDLWPRADIYVQRRGRELVRFNCRISNEEKSGELKISHEAAESDYKISWLGTADVADLNEIFSTPFLSGQLNGTFAVKMKNFKPGVFRGVGQLENFSCHWGAEQDILAVKRLFIHGSGNNILLDDLNLSLRDETLKGSGTITVMPGSLHLNLDCSSPSFSWSTIEAFQAAVPKGPADRPPFVLTGRINFDFAAFSYSLAGRDNLPPFMFVWTPLQGVLSLHDSGKKSFNIESAELCGLDMNGLLEWHGGQGERRLTISSSEGRQNRFEEVLPCLNVSSTLEGPFEFSCRLKGTEKEWSSGEFSLDSRKGNLRQMVLLSNIFRVINFTELLRDYQESGFPYSLMEISGHVAADNIILDKARIDGRGLDLLAEGEVNISSMDSDLTVYVVPLKTFDSMLNMVPVVGRAVGGRKGHIVTIPISITGNIREPDLNVMSVKAVGLSTLKWIGDTLLLPFDLFIRPFTDDSEPDEEENR